MFKPNEIVIDAVVPRLLADYDRLYGDAEPAHRGQINAVARMALGKIAHSDALFHDLEHTLNVTQVMQELLEGRRAVDGDVNPHDWVHMVTASLCFALGFVRPLLQGDSGNRCVIDARGKAVTLEDGATDAALMPWVADRSMLFVRRRFAEHPVIDAELLAEAIAGTRLPIAGSAPLAPESWPGLLRAAQVVGTIGDPNFMLKLTPLFLELKETGQHTQLGYADAGQLRARYPDLFWQVFVPHLGLATRYLRETENGRQWLANMNAHLLAEEHRADAFLPGAV